MLAPSGLLPLRSVGPEPGMISTTGGGSSVRGNSKLPYSVPLPVSRLIGRCSTVGAEAWARPLNSRATIESTRNIMRPLSGRWSLDRAGRRRFAVRDELNG
ncbi:hypothetical protein D9M71_719140 [compost metagenome]